MATIKFRRATAAVAASNNVTLAAGEPGYETDTGRFKIGDGVTDWNNLPYAASDDEWDFSAHSGAFPTIRGITYVVTDNSVLPEGTWIKIKKSVVGDPTSLSDFYTK